MITGMFQKLYIINLMTTCPLLQRILPERGWHRHVHDDGGGESLIGPLRDHIWYPLHCEVGHWLQSVHSYVEMFHQCADMVRCCHLEEMQESSRELFSLVSLPALKLQDSDKKGKYNFLA